VSTTEPVSRCARNSPSVAAPASSMTCIRQRPEPRARSRQRPPPGASRARRALEPRALVLRGRSRLPRRPQTVGPDQHAPSRSGSGGASSGGLVRANLEHSLQAQGRDALRVARHIPGRGEEDREWSPRPIKDRPWGRRDTPSAAATRPTPVAEPPPDHLITAQRATEGSGHLNQSTYSRHASSSGNQASTSP